VAGAYLPADIFVRYLRSSGKDVAFICGSDEHGAAITLRAKKEGTSPREIVDRYHEMLKGSFSKLGINFDIYHRTSSPEHQKMASDFFLELYNKGVFTKKTTEQYFDEEAGQFLADRYITGTCPKCGHESAYGDQCENCGSTLSPTELKNPVSTLSGKTPILKMTTHYYLPLDRYEDWLRTFILEGKDGDKIHHDPSAWKNHVIGQCRSWLDGGLQERAMTRDLDWGVPVPFEGEEGKVLYVWLDAPIGYISATKAWSNDWEKWWKDEDAELIHFIGKDNIVFHCLIFPSLLKAHGEFILPSNVPAMEFMNLEGQKISTSRNWAVWIHEYMEDFPDMQDAMRYTLCSLMPENKDSEFTWNDFKDRNNNELADILGNFVNRVVVLTGKYYDGKVPSPDAGDENAKKVLKEIRSYADKIGDSISRYRFRDALLEAMNLARLGNKYLTDSEPWKLIKQDEDAVRSIMYSCIQICGALSVVLEPFIPFTAQKLRVAFGTEGLTWADVNENMISSGSTISNPGILFRKVEDKEVEEQLQKLEASKTAAAGSALEEIKEEASFEDFTKMDIRAGVITAAEKVAKAKKLLKLTVDIGLESRTVVSGIAEFFEAEEVVGKRVCLLANLAPRKIRGVESQGMVLMAESPDGRLDFVQADEGAVPGSIIR
jgi:methionyl-tRNA synthetase